MKYIQERCFPIFCNSHELENISSFEGEVYLSVKNTETKHIKVYRFLVASKNTMRLTNGFLFGSVMYFDEWSIDELDENINAILSEASETHDEESGFLYIATYMNLAEV